MNEHVITNLRWDPSYWPSGQGLIVLAYIFVGLAVLIVGRLVWAGLKTVWKHGGPMRRYMQIGGEAGLTTADRWWLWCVARRCGLSTPLTLLTCRATLRHHAQKFLEMLPRYHAARLQARLDRIDRRLFGEGE